ncbi:MAG: DNA polymerase III subunit alpha [Halanaerobiales bacterium]
MITMTKGKSHATNGEFVHLHNHTEYSLLDGAVRVEELIQRAKEYNMPAVAMTDHGVLYGIIKFYKKALEENIKPILGCEVYMAPESMKKKDSQKRYHLVLLAKNNKGYQNLIKIVSRGWLDGFYYKPRVDKDLLYENRKGLIALSACLQGEIPQLILQGKKDKAKKVISDYQAIFGKKDFYLELQDHNLPEEKKVNSQIIKLANKYKLPVVLTNDVHYLNRSQADTHEVLLALKTGKTLEDEKRMTFEGEEFYFKSSTEMKKLMPEVKSAINNTIKIADKCNVELDFNTFHLPSFPGSGKESPEELLREKCDEGLREKGLENSEEARERLEYEINVVKEMGYIPYFLIVWDFVDYARRNNIRVGPGRGSAAGSLVSYLLGITKINPLKYGLIFERFLNPERVTMPDIDIDFDERRDEIINYVKERYGSEKVAQIGTFGTMAARAVIRDVGRVMNLPYGKVDKIAKMIPSRPGVTLKEALEQNSNLANRVEKDKEVKELIEYARDIEGMPRHISTHAAGVIIGPDDLINWVPLQLQDDSVITQFPMEELEDLGLLKMDFLGLRNLTVIENTLKLIEKRHGEQINIENINLDDEEVYKMLQEGRTQGVFQMESYLFQDLNQRLQPEVFSDLIALLALGRPGPLNSGLVDDYIKCRHGEKDPEYLHPSLEPILKETFGLILYQEQVMEIASELAGYSMGEADLLRRGMGKKKKKLIAQEREKFVSGAKEKNNIKEEIAHSIFDQMEYFAGYGFNKSHSAAYALLAYQTAYLKVKYPAEFFSALLSSVMNNQDKVAGYIEAAQKINIKVLPPDVNESNYGFTPVDDSTIRFGLKVIKNLGSKAIKSIINNRKDKGYDSLSDFLNRIDLSHFNIQMLEALIKSGAMDSFGPERARLLVKHEELYDKYNSLQREGRNGQTSFFDIVSDDDSFYDEEITYPKVNKLNEKDKLKWEKEYLGIYVSGHPLDTYSEKIKLLTNYNSRQLINEGEPPSYFKTNVAGLIQEKKNHLTKRNKQMAFLTIEDWFGKINVIVFPDLYQDLDISLLEEGNAVFIHGYFKDGDSLIAKKIINLKKEFLYINLNKISLQKLSRIKYLISSNNGGIPIFIKVNKKIILVDENYWIQNKDKDFLKKLQKITGRNNFNIL